MDEPTNFVEIIRSIGRSTVVSLAAWGMAGGATAALVVRARMRELLRLVVLGGLISAGAGTLATSLIVAMFNLPPEAIPAGTAIGSGSYLIGIFGASWIEVVLSRFRAANAEADGDV